MPALPPWFTRQSRCRCRRRSLAVAKGMIPLVVSGAAVKKTWLLVPRFTPLKLMVAPLLRVRLAKVRVAVWPAPALELMMLWPLLTVSADRLRRGDEGIALETEDAVVEHERGRVVDAVGIAELGVINNEWASHPG